MGLLMVYVLLHLAKLNEYYDEVSKVLEHWTIDLEGIQLRYDFYFADVKRHEDYFTEIEIIEHTKSEKSIKYPKRKVPRIKTKINP